SLKKHSKSFELKIKRIQNMINKIRSMNISRKELAKKSISDSAVLDQKVKIINNQITTINYLIEVLEEEIKRIKIVSKI
ncbi:MAG: hypothetical protein ACFE8N_06440, partial [Promethearchaeota archaeon]